MERQQVTFNGYVPMESVIKYIQEFEYLAAVKLYTAAQQKAVLGASIQGPAKVAYDQAVLLGAQGIAQGTGDADFVRNAKEWLRRTYHTADIQQGIRDQIQNMYQGPDEDPQTFSTRINHALSLSGYGAQVSI